MNDIPPTEEVAASPRSDFERYQPGSRYPAWVFSMLFHAALLPLILLMFASTPSKGIPGDGGETVRDVSIVVARASKYEPVQPNSSAAAASSAHQSALPPNTIEAPVLPDVELPTNVLPTRVGTVGAPTMSARGNPQVTTSYNFSDLLAEEDALRRARAAQGDSVNMSLFGGPNAQGRSFVFVIDRSKSMGSSGLDALNALAIELETALAHLQPEHRFTVIAYHHQPFYLEGRKLLQATDENKAKIAHFFRNLAAFGQTEHELGIKAALYLNPDVVYLLTDGGLPALEAPQRGLIRRDARRTGTSIHCIHFGSREKPRAGHFLMELAKENAGGYSYVRMK